MPAAIAPYPQTQQAVPQPEAGPVVDARCLNLARTYPSLRLSAANPAVACARRVRSPALKTLCSEEVGTEFRRLQGTALKMKLVSAQ